MEPFFDNPKKSKKIIENRTGYPHGLLQKTKEVLEESNRKNKLPF
jgi:hypothetical protein